LKRAEGETVRLARESEIFTTTNSSAASARQVLSALAELGMATTDELKELIGDGALVERALRWGEYLHLVTRASDGAWQVDSVLARALVATSR
jgi:DNA-binding IclR family transcriptional regulator